MKTHLTDIARHELEMLLRDAKEAVNGLERQRKSAKQAVEAAQEMQRCRFDFSNEEQMRLVRLLDTVCHLENVLDKTLDEIEHIEGRLSSPETSQLIVWSLPVNSVADDDCP
jgi:multidrug resistance efflux pump